ncbi:hypothetical protein [Streptomyces violens]|uniref:hypothetical protein n=1 Tax=Streptomyces violens TaxID=66377 RepID=UPI0004BFBF30|nr:hypothetical protein [Streptomyces violens]
MTATQRLPSVLDALCAPHTGGPDPPTSRDQIARLVHAISDLVAVVRQARPEDKAEIYRQLGLRLTYDSARMTVRAEITPDPHRPQSPSNDKSHGLRETVGKWSVSEVSLGPFAMQMWVTDELSLS